MKRQKANDSKKVSRLERDDESELYPNKKKAEEEDMFFEEDDEDDSIGIPELDEDDDDMDEDINKLSLEQILLDEDNVPLFDEANKEEGQTAKSSSSKKSSKSKQKQDEDGDTVQDEDGEVQQNNEDDEGFDADEIEEDFVDALDEEANEKYEKEALEEEEFLMKQNEVYIPQPKRHIPKNYTEEFEVIESAYHSYHKIRLEWPFLSFSILKDSLDSNRTKYPHTLYAVGGSQASDARSNGIYVFKVYDVYKTDKDGIDVEDEVGDLDTDRAEGEHFDETEYMETDPIIKHIKIPVPAEVNRIRSMPQKSNIIASWLSTPAIQIHDIQESIQTLDDLSAYLKEVEETVTDHEELEAHEKKKIAEWSKTRKLVKDLGKLTYHKEEGFAMDWSPAQEGYLATGDGKGKIHISHPGNGGQFVMDSYAWSGHQGSVEDIQWSPSQAPIFASSSTDRNIAIWDTRKKGGPAMFFQASTTDVNVISWNRLFNNLLASGDDDGVLRVWDLRAIHAHTNRVVIGNGTIHMKNVEPVGQFDYHKHAITSIEWHPFDNSVLAATSDDNMATIWDFSLESDPEQSKKELEEKIELPPQLLFIHMGQEYIKEVHWHPQINGMLMTAAQDGLNLWKPSNL